MSETRDITSPIVEALTKAGIFCLRLNSGVAKKGKYYIRLCPAGTADLLICPPNRLPIWAETKKPKEQGGHTNREQVTNQAEFRATVERLGHVYVKATSLADVMKVLSAGAGSEPAV